MPLRARTPQPSFAGTQMAPGYLLFVSYHDWYVAYTKNAYVSVNKTLTRLRIWARRGINRLARRRRLRLDQVLGRRRRTGH